MKKTKLERLPMAAAMLLVVFVVAACAIRLRDDGNQTRPLHPLPMHPIR